MPSPTAYSCSSPTPAEGPTSVMPELEGGPSGRPLLWSKALLVLVILHLVVLSIFPSF
ncbi:hypothetical protein SERLA73DRAFT_179543 [Serpula lacrymans var. lacrymans S7.3]|uniref:Uncharacterized protein n=2 Tax=Serpula lacrymans var. lacrymans TaxID=341189 RepID=F8PST0_SERL3|nr:uncharacterized protein SERLADRAFT_464726 [Serpula lacrymans var. lacrymans S7.9]EGO01358.1 hypothetical protein SERLA73DRAFT_179543 [Serpula lacrymans var. lacrymans S7.3]EGO26997.1 hypothetical protein SERLADRAFT_464726 [Serpula lacrymans var. lacrymans S7.9]